MMEININGEVHIHFENENEGIKQSIHKIRTSSKVTNAKKKVKSRDGVCQCCGKNGQIEVHHLQTVANNPDQAADLGNMISLCQKCHRRYHDEYKGEENAVTFALFMKRFAKRY